ncbi:GNAT family N-acetyltransferase [Paenibacillus campinasensis]|nr:GNAT family N-acetyltransferase [Paenibacillus campinasensis]
MDSRYRFLEEYSINHWPSLSTLMFDGWVLRFADGYTRRANSISPLYPAGRGAGAETSMDVIEKIRHCERIYAENRLPTIFKITPGVHPAHLDRVLEERGYSLADTCCVLTLHWEQLPEPEPAAVTIDEGDGSEWMAHFCAISGVTDRDTQILTRMLANMKARKGFISLSHEGQVVACGLGVLEGDYIGLYNIVTAPSYRNQGFGKQLILNLLRWGQEHGARHSYLQVVCSNAPALRLYGKLGYTETYRYWYRVKENLNIG